MGPMTQRPRCKCIDAEVYMPCDPRNWTTYQVVLLQAAPCGADPVVDEDRRTRRRWAALLPAYLNYGFPVRRARAQQLGLAQAHWRTENREAPEQLWFLAGAVP